MRTKTQKINAVVKLLKEKDESLKRWTMKKDSDGEALEVWQSGEHDTAFYSPSDVTQVVEAFGLSSYATWNSDMRKVIMRII